MLFLVPEFQGEPDDIAREKCKLAAKEVNISLVEKTWSVWYGGWVCGQWGVPGKRVNMSMEGEYEYGG